MRWPCRSLDVANREADVSAKKMDLERTRDALQLIMGAGTPARQIAAWQAIYPDNTAEIQVVPVASVTKEENAVEGS